MTPPTRPSRASQGPSRLPPDDAADELEKAQALRDVLEHAVEFTRAVSTARPMESYRSRPVVLAAIAIPSLLLCLYSFIARPDWVFGHDPARSSPARQEAHLRFAMFLVSQRLNAYRDAHGGALPQSLPEVGETWAHITYEILPDSGFELRALAGSGRPIALRSDQDARAFLGPSARHLREQRP